MVRGGKTETLEGDWQPYRLILVAHIRFRRELRALAHIGSTTARKFGGLVVRTFLDKHRLRLVAVRVSIDVAPDVGD